MKILTNKIFGQTGGINRRVYEMGKYFNAHKDNALVVVKMGNKRKTSSSTSGNVKEYTLPFFSWQTIEPGQEKRTVPDHLENMEAFKRFVADVIEEIEKIILFENLDVCFVQGAFYFPWCLTLAAFSKKIPVLQLYCGSTQTEVFNHRLKQAYHALEKGISELSDLTIFNSEKGKSFIKKVFGAHYKDCAVIYNGFPAEYAMYRHKMPSKVTIGWCGRNVVVKNLNYLLKIRQHLAKSRYPIYVITALKHNSPISREFAEKGIKVLPQLKPEEMPKFYQRVSCVISTSYFEFFSNVTAEAVAAGRVPIVPKNSGIAEILLDNNLGDLIVNLDNINEVVATIVKSPQFINQIRDLSEKLVKDYSWDRVIEKYLCLCEKLINPS